MHKVKAKTADGTTIYGIRIDYGDGAKEALKEGKLLIADAVTPRLHVVRAACVEEIQTGDSKWTPDGISYTDDDYGRYVRDAEKAAREVSLKSGKLAVGSLFAVGVADGHACYVVTKVNPKTAEIEWRGFYDDRYVDRQFGWGGRFKRADVEPHVNFGGLFVERQF